MPCTLCSPVISYFHINANRCKLDALLWGKIALFMALKTKGFVNNRQLHRHFTEHGTDFSASNAQEYEQFADDFLGGFKPPGCLECSRNKGDIVRYDPATQAYGIIDRQSVIRSFYKPVPCSSLPAPVRAATRQSGRCHGHANNTAYFHWSCRRW